MSYLSVTVVILGIRGDFGITKMRVINNPAEFKSTPRNQRNHKVTGNWALVATVQNCPIRGTAKQFPLFIEWRRLDWQVFARGVAR